MDSSGGGSGGNDVVGRVIGSGGGGSSSDDVVGSVMDSGGDGDSGGGWSGM